MSRFLIFAAALVCPAWSYSQTLEQQLQNEPAGALAAAAHEAGDAKRGAVLFHQVHVGCAKCHAMDGSSNFMGPDLTRLGQRKDATDDYVVTSVLKPSASILKGFESLTVVTIDGTTKTGLLVSRTDDGIVLRDPAVNGKTTSIAADQIDEVVPNKLSIMPAGIANQLGSRQQFLDLLKYVLEVRDGGIEVARKLMPPPGLIAFTLPEYESHVDHAGLIRSLDDDAFERGQQIYERLCINCHGDKQKPGSLPTALRFAEGKFRSGGDPYAMYRTLTHGFGLMVPQTWMVPQQKYDVIHFIREEYLRDDNAAHYADVTESYLAGLPAGDTFGPEPVDYAPWSDMNYGPSMVNTFEIGSDGTNFAHKGIAVRLDPGPGGIAKGNKWVIFDHDTMRLAAAWTRDPKSDKAGFINWQGIHFDGRHGTHPRVEGDVHFSNPTGPGWAKPGTADFSDDQRVLGRDDKRYGPLPKQWAEYHGQHTVGNRTIIEYSVARRRVLEEFGQHSVSFPRRPISSNPEIPRSAQPDFESAGNTVDVFTSTLNLDRSDHSNLLLVATHPDSDAALSTIADNVVLLQPVGSQPTKIAAASQFDGRSSLLINDAKLLDMTTHDFSIAARIRTSGNGTIFSQANAVGPWTPNAKTFFLRDGRLCYDIGWVGVVTSKNRINDGKWHDVCLTWEHKSGRARFYIDGKHNGGGTLRPTAEVTDTVAKIGFSADNFPNPSHFTGQITAVAFWDSALKPAADGRLPAWPELSAPTSSEAGSKSPGHGVAPLVTWDLSQPPTETGAVVSSGAQPLKAVIKHDGGSVESKAILAGVSSSGECEFAALNNRLCLKIPGSEVEFPVVVWTASVDASSTAAELQHIAEQMQQRPRLSRLTSVIDRHASQPSSTPVARWPDVITTTPVIGSDDGPFAIDILTTPASNPWLARIRLTGHDFFDDGDRMAVCSWDGDVWLVSGLRTLSQLKWQRIASGLFQPLGLKVVDGEIYVTCRDQLVILRDHNGDGETDFYECFNSDHQVTPHFHEFAMGLQRDDAGNFYYAKSARHALKAVVPHHGTLLRIPPDGSRTDVLANGFRAANGVCLNSDGSFIVTDQEGHWNPKNRINWVREGGFYGNMFGYHDVTSDSDAAMEQPLCWITNAFDRSPAELLWINNDAWGPLNGSLLNLSYGYGKVYVVPHEEKHGQMQGGMCEFPIPQFPTGLARGRISPHDDALYVCGMFAWGSSQQTQEGGLYRIRPTGRPAHLPVRLKASGKQLTITFTDSLDTTSAAAPGNYTIKVWSLKRTANYGSKHFDEHEIEVTAVQLSDDHRTVTLTIPDLAKTWCMEIKCRLKSAAGEEFERIIHNTIHHLE